MPSYIDEICPVCNKSFTEGDDIVICPHCGTPHHRACYGSLGHCANEEKHGTDFSFTLSSDKEEEDCAAFSQKSDAKKDSAAQGKRCIRCNSELEGDAVYCSHCGQRQPSKDGEAFSPFSSDAAQAAFSTGYEKSEETIDGKSVRDIADIVRTNTRRFIPKFIENKKISWNWGALFFGPYYLFFRKMYKQGIIAMAIRLIISLIAQGLYADEFAELTTFLNANYTAIAEGSIDNELLTRMSALTNELVPMLIIIIVANALLHLVLALLSDGFYRGKVFSLLNGVDSKLEEGVMFEQSVLFSSSEPLSQDDMKRLYLSKIGGTTLLSPITAFFVYDLITSFISQL